MSFASVGRRALVILVALLVGLAGGGAVGLLAQGRPRILTPDIGPVPPDPPAVKPLTPDTLLAWVPSGLPPGLGGAVRQLPGVQHVVSVMSGTVWLTGSSAADGTTVDRLPSGLAIPLEVAGANLRRYSSFLSPVDRSILPALARGEAAIGTTSAALRQAGPGSTLVFGSRRIRVAAIVPDAVIGAHEVFVSPNTARALGVTRHRYLLIDPAPGASRRAITARITRLLPAGALLRVRGPGETPYFRHGDAVLPQVRVKELFGEFAARPIEGGWLQMDPRWAAEHIQEARVPLLGRVVCNRALIPQLRGALAEVAAEGLGHLIDPGDYGGCYAARFLNRNPQAGLSHHTWGIAVDINVSTNQYGRTPHQDARVVAIFERWGFTWGGHWLLPDGMHFEFVRFARGV